MNIHDWAVYNNDYEYADCDLIIDTDRGEWRFVLSLEKETGRIYSPNYVEYAATPEDVWEEVRLGAVPPDVRRLYEERRPYGVAMLQIIKQNKE